MSPDRFSPELRLLRLARALERTRAGLTLEEMREVMATGDRTPSRSTAERAKRALARAYPELECVNEGQSGPLRWRLPVRAGLPIAVNAAELAALDRAAVEAERQGHSIDARSLRSAAAKLRAAAHPDALRRAEPDAEILLEASAVAYRPGPQQNIDPAVGTALADAILHCHRVRIVYRGRESGKTSRQTLSPLGFLRGGRNYLIAWSHGVRAIRNFAMTNVLAVEMLDDPAFRPRGWRGVAHHVRDWFGVYAEETSEIVLHFSKRVADDVLAYQFHPSQVVTRLKSGSVKVSFRAGGLQEIAWHLASWGSNVRVVRPERLKTLYRRF
jgi:predicted DNA-binding transcriptional regulator YafY